MRTFKKWLMCLVVLLCLTTGNKIYSQTTDSIRIKAQVMNWTPIMNAIIQVESGGDPNAVGGKSAGILQITPILVKQCNLILKAKKSSKRYTLQDRYNVTKSKEMFVLIQEYYNKEGNLEKAIRLWNGGPNYSTKGTQKYLNKVMRYYSKQINKN